MNKKSRLEWKFKDLPSLDAFQSRKEWEAACLNKVLETKGVLEILLTPKERHNLVIRAAAVESLASGKSYRQIGRELWVSPQTLSGLRKAVAENVVAAPLASVFTELNPETQQQERFVVIIKDANYERRPVQIGVSAVTLVQVK